MKITINGILSTEGAKQALDKQLEKKNMIDKFCKENKIKELIYKDAELEYNYNIGKKSQGGVRDE